MAPRRDLARFYAEPGIPDDAILEEARRESRRKENLSRAAAGLAPLGESEDLGLSLLEQLDQVQRAPGTTDFTRLPAEAVAPEMETEDPEEAIMLSLARGGELRTPQAPGENLRDIINRRLNRFSEGIEPSVEAAMRGVGKGFGALGRFAVGPEPSPVSVQPPGTLSSIRGLEPREEDLARAAGLIAEPREVRPGFLDRPGILPFLGRALKGFGLGAAEKLGDVESVSIGPNQGAVQFGRGARPSGEAEGGLRGKIAESLLKPRKGEGGEGKPFFGRFFTEEQANDRLTSEIDSILRNARDLEAADQEAKGNRNEANRLRRLDAKALRAEASPSEVREAEKHATSNVRLQESNEMAEYLQRINR
jgi:hypothetical protein